MTEILPARLSTAAKEAEQRMEEERRQKEEEHRKKEEEEHQKQEVERKRKEQKLREYRLKNKLCLEYGAKPGFWDKLSDMQYCKRHRR